MMTTRRAAAVAAAWRARQDLAHGLMNFLTPALMFSFLKAAKVVTSSQAVAADATAAEEEDA